MQEVSPTHAAALALAADGVPVFPCVVDGKEPACPHGVNDATTDVDQINKWWIDNPRLNIGIAPDKAGMFVIDIDIKKHGEQTWASFCAEHALSDLQTYEVRTPSGGRHLYFDGHGPTSVDKIGPGVDTRGKGGYVLVPPSVVNGKRYEHLTDFGLAAIPAIVATRLKPSVEPSRSRVGQLDLPSSIGRARSYLVGIVQRGLVAVEFSGGNNRTFQVACDVRDLGISEPLCASLLSEIFNPACKPPWDEDDLTAIVSHAYEYGQNEPGAYGVAPAAEVFKHAPPPEPSKPVKNRFMSVDQMAKLPDPTWLVPELLMCNSTALYVGAWSSYKSFIALDIALAIASGRSTALGPTPAFTGPVIYSAREGIVGLAKARRRAWCIGHGMGEDEPLPFYLGPSPMVNDDADCQSFLTDAKAVCGRPQLVVIDTLSRSMAGLDETKDAGMFLQLAQGLVDELGCCVLVLHHFGHDKSRNARGGTIYPANFDTYLEGEAKGQRRVEIWVKKQKDAEERGKPFTAQGFKVGPALMFKPTTNEDHIRAIAAADPFAKEVVGAALNQLNAIGPDEAVTTSILAQQMFPRLETELTVETYMARIEIAAKTLQRYSHNRLIAYCSPSPTGPRWHLPPW